MTTIPEICLQYTEVFRTLRFEYGIVMVIGIAIGFYLGKRGDK